MKYILLLTLFMTTFKTDEKRDWFRVFHKEVEYYTWVSESGNVYHFTNEALDSLRSSYETWGDTVHLKAIVLKDVE